MNDINFCDEQDRGTRCCLHDLLPDHHCAPGRVCCFCGNLYEADVGPHGQYEPQKQQRPIPPEILADALQDRIFPTSGKLLKAKPVHKTKKRKIMKVHKDCPDCLGSGCITVFDLDADLMHIVCGSCGGTGWAP
jgi:hypothetical protein